METILGLLLVLLPLIFKLVEKKLKSSGNTKAADKVHEWAEVFGQKEDDLDDKEDDDDDDDDVPATVTVIPVDQPAQEAPSVVAPVQPVPVRSAAARVAAKKPSKPMFEEEETKKKEKIDPKKLVVYSEIMKPKF